MIRRFAGQLPSWARPDHPVLRRELGSTPRAPWQVRYGRALGVVLLGGLLLLGGYLAATQLLRQSTGENFVESLNTVLFYPLLIIQVLLRIVAVTMTSNTISEEMRRQHWDSLRSTPFGAELTMRARWASVFYRLRGLLGVVLVTRLVLIVGMLWELTSFRGRLLDNLTAGIMPEVAIPIAVLLLSLLLTASLLLPLTAVGFDASVGLLISAAVQHRTYTTFMQALYILFRIAIVVALTIAATQFLEGTFVLSDVLAWLVMFLFAAMGDLGLAFLWVVRFGEIWATVPFGIFLGLALAVFALLQAAAADQILLLAVRRAQRKG